MHHVNLRRPNWLRNRLQPLRCYLSMAHPHALADRNHEGLTVKSTTSQYHSRVGMVLVQSKIQDLLAKPGRASIAFQSWSLRRRQRTDEKAAGDTTESRLAFLPSLHEEARRWGGSCLEGVPGYVAHCIVECYCTLSRALGSEACARSWPGILKYPVT